MWHKQLEKEWIRALGRKDSVQLAKLILEINGDGQFFVWLKYHGLVGLSKHITHQLGIDLHLGSDLEAYNKRQIMGAMGVLHQAEQIIHLLSDEGINAILLKGGALNRTVYPSVGLRWMGDIDLLVWEKDVTRAVEIIIGSGYQQSDAAVLKLGEIHAPPLMPQKNGLVPVEIHWGLLPKEIRWFTSDYLDWFWAHLDQVGTEEKRLFVLDDLAMLFHLAIHLVLWHGVHDISYKWLFDIDYLVQKRGKDPSFWQMVVAEADYLGWSDIVAVCFDIVNEWVGTEIPQDVRHALENQRNEAIRAVIERQLVGEADYGRGVWFRLKMLSNWARWRGVWRIVFPSRAYMRAKYNLVYWWQLPIAYGQRLATIGNDFFKGRQKNI